MTLTGVFARLLLVIAIAIALGVALIACASVEPPTSSALFLEETVRGSI